MTTMFTTGHAFSDFEALQRTLAAAGVAQAAPTDSANAPLIDLPARLQADPALRAVLVYESPTICVARALNETAPGAAASPERLLEDWRKASEAMLGLAIRQPDRCVLVNGSASLLDPGRFVAVCSQVLGLGDGTPVQANAAAASTFAPLSTLETWLAESMVADDQDAPAIFDELESCAHLGASVPGDPKATGAAAWADYTAMRADASRTEALASAAQEVAGLTAAKAALEQRCESLQRERDRSADLVTKAGRALDGKLAELANATGLSQHLQRESESLLLKLHEAHVESETFFGQAEALRAELATANEERVALKDSLANALENGAAQRVQLLVHAGALDRSRDQLSRAEAEKEELAAQLTARLTDIEQCQAKLSDQAATAKAAGEEHAAQLGAVAAAHLAEMGRHGETSQLLDRQRQHITQLSDRVASLDAANQLIASGLAEAEAARALLHAYWREQQPAEFVIDLRRAISGSNWYDAEPDGRWTGPERVSTLTLPALSPGNYSLELQVVGAMSRDINDGLKVDVNGMSMPITFDRVKHPSVATATFTTHAMDASPNWVVSLTVPNVRSPADKGGSDLRQLGVRIGQVKFITLQKG